MIERHAGIIISILTLTVLGAGFLLHEKIGDTKPNSNAAVVCTGTQNGNLSITGKAAYAIDLESEMVLFEKNSSQQLPLASLTKLMTILVASHTLDLDSSVQIPEAALAPEGDAGLQIGEKWRVRDLIDFTLMTSANDGAHALALLAANTSHITSDQFIETMNETARTLHLTQTYFLNDTGLDVSTTTSGAYGSAEDIALLLAEIYKKAPAVFSASATKERTFVSRSGLIHRAEHTSSIAGNLPGEIVAKTGFTDLAGGNLAIVAEPILGHPVAIVVLGSTKEGRDQDVALVYDYVKSALKQITLCEKGI